MRTRESRRLARAGAILLGLAISAVGCDSGTPCRPFDLAGTSADQGAATEADLCVGTLDADGSAFPTLAPSGVPSAPSGILSVPCQGEEGARVETHAYGCGTCGGDLFYPVVCHQGRLACPSSYLASQGVVVTVWEGAYVVDMGNWQSNTGQCAHLATYQLPGFRVTGPDPILSELDTDKPLVLQAVSASGRSRPSFAAFFQDRERGQQAIHALVDIVDRTLGVPVAYTIGEPQQDATTMGESVALTPVIPWVLGHAYRVTVQPAEAQSFVACHTYGSGAEWLTAPASHDFFAYSRPTIATMFIAYKSGTTGYLAFEFNEPLADLAGYPEATVSVDGIPFPGCMMPYACSGAMTGASSTQPTQLRLDSTALPTTFSAIVLRVPHAVKSVHGGSLLEGTRDNPDASVEGEFAVYTFNATAFTPTGEAAVKTWTARNP